MRVIEPLSAPSNNNLFSGKIVKDVRTPLKVSDFNLADEKVAELSIDE